ncbi:hypothetical protein RFF05_06690 [Bengtsoniella intestinalis]|uniref:hypothetical protein n=1 Tax=Bengtsoniella intestinalis TaxID=3073143 RepID=UPI00391F9417
MTRQRFVKLLMGVGATRNEAGEIAGRRPPTVSYKDYYSDARMMAIMLHVGVSVKKAGKAVVKATKAYAKASISFAELTSALFSFCAMGADGWIW